MWNAAEQGVDVALVLAADCSGSIGDEELALQFRGYARAVTNEVFIKAGRSGRHGRIALTFAGWSSADRQVIDISGDGTNNDGRAVTQAREEAVAAGITINGLPIIRSEPDIVAYYVRNVIGGPGSFVTIVKGSTSFYTFVLERFVTEIAGAPYGGHPV